MSAVDLEHANQKLHPHGYKQMPNSLVSSIQHSICLIKKENTAIETPALLVACLKARLRLVEQIYNNIHMVQ